MKKNNMSKERKTSVNPVNEDGRVLKTKKDIICNIIKKKTYIFIFYFK